MQAGVQHRHRQHLTRTPLTNELTHRVDVHRGQRRERATPTIRRRRNRGLNLLGRRLIVVETRQQKFHDTPLISGGRFTAGHHPKTPILPDFRLFCLLKGHFNPF
jgi:hypothetical protein